MRAMSLILALAIVIAPGFALANEHEGADCKTKCHDSKDAECMKKCEAEHAHH